MVQVVRSLLSLEAVIEDAQRGHVAIAMGLDAPPLNHAIDDHLAGFEFAHAGSMPRGTRLAKVEPARI